jgi:hypothetical protein
VLLKLTRTYEAFFTDKVNCGMLGVLLHALILRFCL